MNEKDFVLTYQSNGDFYAHLACDSNYYAIGETREEAIELLKERLEYGYSQMFMVEEYC